MAINEYFSDTSFLRRLTSVISETHNKAPRKSVHTGSWSAEDSAGWPWLSAPSQCCCEINKETLFLGYYHPNLGSLKEEGWGLCFQASAGSQGQDPYFQDFQQGNHPLH